MLYKEASGVIISSNDDYMKSPGGGDLVFKEEDLRGDSLQIKGWDGEREGVFMSLMSSHHLQEDTSGLTCLHHQQSEEEEDEEEEQDSTKMPAPIILLPPNHHSSFATTQSSHTSTRR